MNTAMNTAAVPNPALNVLGRKIAFSSIVQYAGKAAQLVLAMLTLKLISNFLSQNDYGVYAKIMEYALFFSTAANLGIFANLVRVMAGRPRDGKVFINALILRMLTAIAFFLPALLYLVLSGNAAAGAQIAGAGAQAFLFGSALFFGSLFFDFITTVCDGMLQANYMMGRANIALVAGRIINFALTLVLIKFFLAGGSAAAIYMLFAATFTGSVVTAAMSIYFVRNKIDWSWSLNKKMICDIFVSGLPFGIIILINNLYFRFLPDYFAQGALTEAQFGSFNISFRIAQVASLFSTFLMYSALPGFREYVEQKHWQKAHLLLDKIWKILLAAGAILLVGGTIFGNFAIELMTHKKFILPEFWFVLPLMLLLAAVSYGYDLIVVTLFGLKKDIWLLKRECLALGVALVFFGISNMVPEVQLKLFLIITAAIAGEAFMVISGTIKIKNIFRDLA